MKQSLNTLSLCALLALISFALIGCAGGFRLEVGPSDEGTTVGEAATGAGRAITAAAPFLGPLAVPATAVGSILTAIGGTVAVNKRKERREDALYDEALKRGQEMAEKAAT